jgi:GAF domain-containing protein
MKNKSDRYNRLFKQIETIVQKSPHSISAMATVSAILFNKMEYYSWCGFYFLHHGELICGPYQGPVACQLLAKHTGVCWKAIDTASAQVLPDVEKFPGHIACDSRTRSEVVVPVRDASGNIVAVFDVDSHQPDSFDQIDAEWLIKIVALLEPIAL